MWWPLMAYCSYTVFVKVGEMVHIHDNLFP